MKVYSGKNKTLQQVFNHKYVHVYGNLHILKMKIWSLKVVYFIYAEF